jgi:hypothetical protein
VFPHYFIPIPHKLLAQGITWFLYEPLGRPFFPSTFIAIIAIGAGVANVADFLAC